MGNTGPGRSYPRTGPIEVRSLNHPKPGWTATAATELLHQGYSPEQAERMSGFAAAFLRAQTDRLSRRASLR